MKKIFSKLLICLGLIVCLGLVGCGPAPETPPNSNTDNEIVEPSQPEPVEPDTPPEEPDTPPEDPEIPPVEDPPADETNNELIKQFEALATKILETLSMSYEFDHTDEDIVKKEISAEKLEIRIDLTNTDFSEDEDYFQEVIDDMKDQTTNLVNRSEIGNLNSDCKTEGFIFIIIITKA